MLKLKVGDRVFFCNAARRRNENRSPGWFPESNYWHKAIGEVIEIAPQIIRIQWDNLATGWYFYNYPGQENVIFKC